MSNNEFQAERARDAAQSVSFSDFYTKYKGSYVIPFCTTVDTCGRLTLMHKHPYVQLYYAKSGTYKHFIMDSEYILTKGSLVIIPPYYPHALDNRNDGVLIRCDFSSDFIMNTFDEQIKDSFIDLVFLEPVLVSVNKIKPYHYFSEETSKKIEEIFEELCHEYSKKDAFSAMLVRSNIVRLFALIAKEYNIHNRDRTIINYRDALDSAITYINNNFTKHIYLEDVCKIAMMNRQTFSYLFRQIIGMSFSNYLQYLRVLHAKELLKNTDRTQLDIASACGFQSLSFFCRVFKKHTGTQPSEYRKSISDKQTETPSDT